MQAEPNISNRDNLSLAFNLKRLIVSLLRRSTTEGAPYSHKMDACIALWKLALIIKELELEVGWTQFEPTIELLSDLISPDWEHSEWDDELPNRKEALAFVELLSSRKDGDIYITRARTAMRRGKDVREFYRMERVRRKGRGCLHPQGDSA